MSSPVQLQIRSLKFWDRTCAFKWALFSFSLGFLFLPFDSCQTSIPNIYILSVDIMLYLAQRLHLIFKHNYRMRVSLDEFQQGFRLWRSCKKFTVLPSDGYASSLLAVFITSWFQFLITVLLLRQINHISDMSVLCFCM
jgi:hypothetical protein